MSGTDYYDALPIGYKLHEYVIEKVLGQGGFGITYLAHDNNLNKKVAIKEYLPEGFAVRSGDSTIQAKAKSREDFQWGLERFLQEAQTLGQFQHPNIVPVLRFFEMNGTAYMVMVYQEGESLANILDEHGTLEESELEEILYPLLDGLRLVHDAGILHRDIKPDNIFIRADGTPVLLDFGAARQAIGDRSKNITRIITPGYAPPEQYHSDGTLGPWTDIYALACVFYEAIAGAPPPEAPSRLAKDRMRKAVQVGGNQFRRKFLQAIDRALQLAAEDRPQTVAEWLAAFPKPDDPALQAIRDRAARSRRLGEWRSGRVISERQPEERAAPETVDPGADTATRELKPGPSPADAVAATEPAGEREFHLVSDLRWAAAGLVLLLILGVGLVGAQFAGLFEPEDTRRGVLTGEDTSGRGEETGGTGDGEKPQARLEGEASGEIGALTEAELAERERAARREAERRSTEAAANRLYRSLVDRDAFMFLGNQSYGVTFKRQNVLQVRGVESRNPGGSAKWRIRGRRLCVDVGHGMRCYPIRRTGRGEYSGRGIRIELQ